MNLWLRSSFILVLFSLSFSLSGQENHDALKGTVLDYFTHTRLENVSITSSLLDTTVSSDELGKFILPVTYEPFTYDTLAISHPLYYTYIRRTNRRRILVYLIPRMMEIDTLCYPSFNENKMIRGVVVEQYRKDPVAGASVSLANDQIIAWTDKNGNFDVGMPRSMKILKISHPDFETRLIKARRNKARMSIKMTKVRLTAEDTLWKSYKNVLTIIPLELVTGGIGVYYQRFIKLQHAIGLYSSVYLFGYGSEFYGGRSKFKGFKLAPAYRYYMWRNPRSGGFVQGKIIGGYFNFSKLYYEDSYGENHINRPAQFWNLGGGIAFGWSVRLPKSKYGIFNITLGYQYFTMDVPQTIQENPYQQYTVEDNWWYFIGPGSLIEVKLAIGEIF